MWLGAIVQDFKVIFLGLSCNAEMGNPIPKRVILLKVRKLRSECRKW